MQHSAGGEKFHIKYVWQSLLDWKTWVASACTRFLIVDTFEMHHVYSVGIHMGLFVDRDHAWFPELTLHPQ